MTHPDDVVAKQHIADLLREAVAQRDGKQASLFGGRRHSAGPRWARSQATGRADVSLLA
jgi:hypothetical protein